MRSASLRALAPGGSEPFASWWEGRLPAKDETGLVFFDPIVGRRRDRRRWVGLAEGLSLRPRYRNYADALGALRAEGLA